MKVLLALAFNILFVAMLTVAALADFKGQLQQQGVDVVYVEDARPLCFPGVDGKPRGLIVDLWKLWSAKTGIPVTFVLTSWEETFPLVVDGNVDIHGGLVRTVKREQMFDFSYPLFSAETVLVSRAGGQSDSLTRDGVVGVVRGTHAERLLRQQHPESTVVEYDTSSMLLSAFAENKVDGVVVYLPTFHLNNKLLDRPVSSEIVEVLAAPETYAAVRKGNKELLEVVNAGFSRISDGERKVILKRWFAYDAIEDTNWVLPWWTVVTLLAVGLLVVFRIIRRRG